MAQDKTVKVRVETDADTSLKSIEDLKLELRALETEFETAQLGTDRFNQLGAQVKAARNNLKDLEASFEGLDKEQRAAALVDTFNGLTGAVGAVSSAFIAFGAEAGAIEDAEKKLLGVIGVVNGLRDVSNGLVAANKLLGPSFEALGTTIKAAMTSGTVATQTLKAALASLGIAALIGGVVALIDYMSSLNEETEKTATTGVEGFEAFNKEIEKGNTLLQARLGYIKAVFGEEEALNTQLAAVQAERAQRRQKETDLFDELNRAETASDKKKIKDLIDENLKKNIELEGQEATIQNQLQKIRDDAAKEEQKKADEAAKKLADTRKARADNEKDALLDEAESKRQLAIQLEDDEKKRRKLVLDDELADLKVARDNALAQENLTAEAKRAIRATYQNNVKAAEDKFTNDIAEIDKKAEEKRIADAEKFASELEAFQDRAYNNEIKSLNEFYTARENEVKANFEKGLITQQQYDAQIQQIELDRLNNLLQATKDAGKSTVEVEKQILDAKLAIKAKDVETTKKAEEQKKAIQDLAFDSALSLLGDLQSLNEIYDKDNEEAAKKAFERNKNLSIAETIISTYLAAQKAYASQIIVGDPSSIIRGQIAAAVAIAGGLARVAVIKSQTFDGGGSSGGGAGAGGSQGSVGGGNILNPFGTEGGGTNILPPRLASPSGGGTQADTSGRFNQSAGQTPIVKAYVLAGDVTDAQTAEMKINQKRKL